jgi:hypothetical protein
MNPTTARTIPPAMNKVVLYGMVNIIIGKLSYIPAGATDVFDIEVNDLTFDLEPSMRNTTI